VAFENRDISENPDSMKELTDMGVFSTPATLIDDELVIGFDRNKLEALLD
jgi:2-hydroxychromene-2-carboxylate isomerase